MGSWKAGFPQFPRNEKEVVDLRGLHVVELAGIVKKETCSPNGLLEDNPPNVQGRLANFCQNSGW